MKNTSLNIAGKLPNGLIELYADISRVADELNIDFLVVGAMARDLVLVHGFGATIARGTKDVDFGINVASWKDFDRLIECLTEDGFVQDKYRVHRLTRDDSYGLTWEVDIVPFGLIAHNETIAWPPSQDIVMGVSGFKEAFKNAINVKINEKADITILVASPAGISILKLIAWLERAGNIKEKDAIDFGYLIQSYIKIPEIHDAIYGKGFAEAQDWDEVKASAMKLGRDAANIVSVETKGILKLQLFNLPAKMEQFARDMQKGVYTDLEQCFSLISIFSDEFVNHD